MSNSPLHNRSELQERFRKRVERGTGTTRPTPTKFNELPSHLRQALPENYTYIIKSYKELEVEPVQGAPTAAFDSTFYINISSAEAIEEWRSAFHEKTGTIFRITRADKVKGIKVIYHKDFHCRHADIAAIKYMQKTYAQKTGQRRSRNTNCQCLAKIRLEKARLQLSHPCEIHLVYNHNHPLEGFPTQSSSSSSSSSSSIQSVQQHVIAADIVGSSPAPIFQHSTSPLIQQAQFYDSPSPLHQSPALIHHLSSPLIASPSESSTDTAASFSTHSSPGYLPDLHELDYPQPSMQNQNILIQDNSVVIPSDIISSDENNIITSLHSRNNDTENAVVISSSSLPSISIAQDHQQQNTNLSILPSSSPSSSPHQSPPPKSQFHPTCLQRSPSNSSIISSHAYSDNNNTINQNSNASPLLADFHEFVKEAQIDIVDGDMEYCEGLRRFVNFHRKARRTSLAHATEFLKQFDWQVYTDGMTTDPLQFAIYNDNSHRHHHHHHQQQIESQQHSYNQQHLPQIISAYQHTRTPIHLMNTQHQAYNQQQEQIPQSYEQQYHHDQSQMFQNHIPPRTSTTSDMVNSRKRSADELIGETIESNDEMRKRFRNPVQKRVAMVREMSQIPNRQIQRLGDVVNDHHHQLVMQSQL
ncbi:hypothetical protein G9A89_023014 [Geosiphon pyriformis]|nr:hypothetical protein G9A89_023014 [Geosiphon pyriformis]